MPSDNVWMLYLLSLGCLFLHGWPTARGRKTAPTSSGLSAGIRNEEIKRYCELMNWLRKHQKQKCLTHIHLVKSAENGVDLALDECRNHFSDHRWNCTGVTLAQVFKGEGMMSTKSRESAFLYAITAAGVAFEITKRCSTGSWDECGCDTKISGKGHSPDEPSWDWGGCSEHVRFGTAFSETYMDPQDDTDKLMYLSAIHNNRAGRKVLKENMDKNCKCHGVSGSCSARICWRVMPKITKVAELLRLQFDRALHVLLNKSKKKLIRAGRGRRGKSKKSNSRKPGSGDLVYVSSSPDFCQANSQLGILGTVGRACDPGSDGTDSCRIMCCGRNYVTRKRTGATKCNCQFVWCCNIKCDVCNQDWVEHRCK